MDVRRGLLCGPCADTAEGRRPEAPAADDGECARLAGLLRDRDAEIARLRNGGRELGKAVVGNVRAMEAARIELAQGSAEKAMQWVLNSLPDVWDDPETAWDGRESAEAWWDRTDPFYRAAVADAKPSLVPTPGPGPQSPSASILGPSTANDAGPSPAPDDGSRETLGRLVHDTRLTVEAERAKTEGRHRFLLGTWEERTPDQRELDMRIGDAVAAAEAERIASHMDALAAASGGASHFAYRNAAHEIRKGADRG